MGLDMFVYHAKKPVHLNDKTIYSYDELGHEGYMLIAEKNMKNAMVADLLPFAVRVCAYETQYDVASIKHNFAFSNIPKWFGFDDSGLWFTDDEKTVVIPHDETGRFTIRGASDWYYAVRLEEIAYWRKNYALQSTLHASYGQCAVENCGYYRLGDAQFDAIATSGVSNDIFESYRHKPECGLFYHEWY